MFEKAVWLIFVSYVWKNTNDLCFISSSLRILSWPCLLLSSFLALSPPVFFPGLVSSCLLSWPCLLFLASSLRILSVFVPYSWPRLCVFSPCSFLALSPPVFFLLALYSLVRHFNIRMSTAQSQFFTLPPRSLFLAWCSSCLNRHMQNWHLQHAHIWAVTKILVICCDYTSHIWEL